ncbi:MAG TPA: YceI family protein [Rhizomicrobium sp.]|nr:YceI family protein [Rhizomicrobium sp.]
MRRFALALGLSVIALSGAAHADGPSVDPKEAPAGAYQTESRHTLVLFAIPHLGLTDYYGRFEKISGTLNFNPGAPEKSSVSATIDTSSVNVMNSELMGQLVGPAVFDSANFPTATFKSTSIERTGPTTGKMTGDLTIHGVTKPVVFDIRFNGGMSAPLGNAYNLGFHATATIKRSDYGLDKMMWKSFVGDDVTLIIEALFEQPRS